MMPPPLHVSLCVGLASPAHAACLIEIREVIPYVYVAGLHGLRSIRFFCRIDASLFVYDTMSPKMQSLSLTCCNYLPKLQRNPYIKLLVGSEKCECWHGTSGQPT